MNKMFKNRNACHLEKKEVKNKKNVWWGNNFRLLLPSFSIFFSPFITQEKSEKMK